MKEYHSKKKKKKSMKEIVLWYSLILHGIKVMFLNFNHLSELRADWGEDLNPSNLFLI